MLKVIYFHHDGNSIKKCANIFNIDRRIISKWIKSEPKILKTIYKINKLSFPALENQLYSWIIEKRSQGACLSGTVNISLPNAN